MKVTAASTPAAQAAMEAFLARVAAGRCSYCNDDLDAGVCRRCEGEAAAEVAAEEGFVRFLENQGHDCRPGCCSPSF